MGDHVRSLVLTDADLEQYAAEHAAGERPGLRPYGMERLEDLGHRLRSVPMRAGGRLVEALEHRTGRRFGRALRAAPVARDSDLVLAVLEQWAWAPGVLARVPRSPYWRLPLVSVVCWAAEDLRTRPERERRRVRALLARSDLVGYWSRNQTETYVAHGIEPDRLVPLTFGVETAFFDGDPDRERDIEVLSVGVDRGRDYATLAAAMRGSTVQVQVLSRPANLAGLDLPPNVRAIGTVPQREYAALLRRARVVVVATHDLAYPTGQTVALEAAAAGAAVVVTWTQAMSEYFSDGETALMPPVGDPLALRGSVERLVADDGLRRRLGHAGREHVLRGHDSARMWDELDRALVERELRR
ncbi:glycosyltransferase [Nocardioides bigeumensis]|uniref:Spore protein YkvP/CgeB glycosyl transferase-like domain-containing protein n=1 Tax=Nocardioides bigeumensis TaxID=433657 RepID=A0ABP5K4Z8_9ACTN